MKPLQLGGEPARSGQAGLRDLSIRVNDKKGARVATWFAPGWQVRRAEPRDERAYFRGPVSLQTRLWAAAAAVRWPAAALCLALMAAHLLGLWSAEDSYSAQATLRSLRAGATSSAATVSAREAAAARAYFVTATLFQDAAADVRTTGESLDRAARQLQECGALEAVGGGSAISVVCRAATPAQAAAGANALATALAERSLADENAAQQAPARPVAPEAGLPIAEQGGSSLAAAGRRPSFHFEVAGRASPAAAAKILPWGRAAGVLSLAALCFIGFVGVRRRSLRTLEEVLGVFEAPVLVVERGGPGVS